MSVVRRANPKEDLPKLVASGRDLSFAVAYVTQAGLGAIRDELRKLLDEEREIRLILDLASGSTDPSAVWDLRGLANQHPSLRIKTIVPDASGKSLHSKLYLAHSDEGITFLTGSANLTFGGLVRNYEHGVFLDGSPNERDARDALAAFEELWTSPQARVVDDEAARLYEAYCGRLRTSQTRAERRAQSSWTALSDHLQAAGDTLFSWPSAGAAYLMGAIAARGEIAHQRKVIEIKLRFNPSAYTDGRITVGDTSYPAAEVLPTIPESIANHVRETVPRVEVSIEGQRILIDFKRNEEAFHTIAGAYAPHSRADTVRLPQGIRDASDNVVTEYVRGFAVASALLTDHTRMPGESGQMMVWLRPKQANDRLFYLLYRLITDRLGIPVYRHERKTRDPHLKIHCQDFREIGFGIQWWDDLVAAGAEYNFNLFPQMGLIAVS